VITFVVTAKCIHYEATDFVHSSTLESCLKWDNSLLLKLGTAVSWKTWFLRVYVWNVSAAYTSIFVSGMFRNHSFISPARLGKFSNLHLSE
jgi:hypothetical protein